MPCAGFQRQRVTSALTPTAPMPATPTNFGRRRWRCSPEIMAASARSPASRRRRRPPPTRRRRDTSDGRQKDFYGSTVASKGRDHLVQQPLSSADFSLSQHAGLRRYAQPHFDLGGDDL